MRLSLCLALCAGVGILRRPPDVHALASRRERLCVIVCVCMCVWASVLACARMHMRVGLYEYQVIDVLGGSGS